MYLIPKEVHKSIIIIIIIIIITIIIIIVIIIIIIIIISNGYMNLKVCLEQEKTKS